MYASKEVPNVKIIKAEKNLVNRRFKQEEKRLRVGAYCRVSTDSEEQAKSYRSQVKYYTNLINDNGNWRLVNIYTDEAISGTNDEKRLGFLKMIGDCEKGYIDLIITKSISRFARNTVDTLRYVRRLKEIGVAVLFEEENINTLTMNGELLLTILSSVAQQEVENTSANVKKGLQMKMKRGELVGWNSCLGYDYDKETKQLSINKKEAKVVSFIFEKYLEGYGTFSIAKMLTESGVKTKRGNKEWYDSAVREILKNVKYKGDLLQGKTFTIDPISKRRLNNYGEEDMFYVKGHHEAIIDEKDFDKVQEKMKERGLKSQSMKGMSREKHSRKYAFSSKLECAFCGSNLSRRSWNASSKNAKTIWQCVTSTKKGKRYCEHSKGIPEKIIENAFIESYALLCENKSEILDQFLVTVKKSLDEENISLKIKQEENKLNSLHHRLSKLTDLMLDQSVNKEDFYKKYNDLKMKMNEVEKNLESLKNYAMNSKSLNERIEEMRKMLENGVKEFDKQVFDSVIEKVIVGEVTESNEYLPYKLTFIYRTGFKNKVIPPYVGRLTKENNKSSFYANKVDNSYSYSDNNTYRVCDRTLSQRYVEILSFQYFEPYVSFDKKDRVEKNKVIRKGIDVSVMVKVDCVDITNN